MMKLPLFKNLEETIGNTPVVSLDRITRNLDGQILAKLEMFNPSNSKKDRIAQQIINDAEENGQLLPEQTVVELTSGNMGTALAMICSQRNYPFVAVMSKGNSVERVLMMEHLGAEVILVEQKPGGVSGKVTGEDLQLVEEMTQEITKKRQAFRADQFNRKGNFLAHYLNTAPELWSQSSERIDGFCDFVGSGGTYAGISEFLKQQNKQIKCFVIEPKGAAVLSGQLIEESSHPIQGGGYGMKNLPLLNNIPIDGYIEVSGKQARSFVHELAIKEGIFAGFSSGANLAGALELLKGPCRGGTVAIILADSGLKYLSTGLWN